MKKVFYIVISIIGLLVITILLITPKINIDIKNDININDIDYVDFQPINSNVSIKTNGETQLLLKTKSSFTISIQKNALIISTYSKNITDTTTNLEKYHLVEIIRGKLIKIYYNDSLIYEDN